MTGRRDFLAKYRTYLREICKCFGGKYSLAKLDDLGVHPLRTLDILRNLDQATATLFGRFCSVCVSIRPDGIHFLDARVPSLGGSPGANALKEYGLGFYELNELNEHGLIISEYNSWNDSQICVGIQPDPELSLILIPFTFQGRYWVLEPKEPRNVNQEFRLWGVALTRAGQELSTIVDIEPMDKYMQALVKFFETQNLRMTEVDSPDLRSIPVSQWPASL